MTESLVLPYPRKAAGDNLTFSWEKGENRFFLSKGIPIDCQWGAAPGILRILPREDGRVDLVILKKN